MKRHLLKCAQNAAVLFAAALAFVFENPAASPPSDDLAPHATSLEDLVAQTLAKNPELRFYEAEIAAARGARRQAGMAPLPELSTSVGAKRATGSGFSSEGTAWSASVLQTFEFPGRISLRKAIANQDVRLAELGLEQFKSALAARARMLGYQLFTAQERARAATEVANRVQELLDFLVQRDPAGVTPLIENRVVEASVVTFRKRAIDASQALQSALFELNLLRGEPLDTPLRIADVQLDFPPVPDREALLASARARNFDIRMRLAELEQQGFKLELSRRQRWPEIAVGPFISQEEAGDRETIAGIGITLPLPLWNRNAGNIETGKARQQQAETSLFTVRLETEKAVMEEWLAYRLNSEELRRWQADSVQRFRQAAELGDRHYRLGSLPIATYLELQREYLDSLDSILSLQTDALASLQRLEVLTQMSLGNVTRDHSPGETP
jgi:cobalt-zinc-cadmium efflux system outer membrane protein